MSTNITLRTHANTSDIHKHHSYTPPTPPPDIIKTYPDNKRSQHISTDISWRQKTLSAILKQHLWGSGDVRDSLGNVCWCSLFLLTSISAWIVSGWCFGVLDCIWMVSLDVYGVRMCLRLVNLHRCDIALKGNIFFTWPYWDIKISKCPDISLTKMVGFCLFLVVLCLWHRN